MILEIEPTGICNAQCPFCSRFTFDRDNLELYNKAEILSKEILDVDAFDNLCRSLNEPHIEFDFQGSYGDPMAHPNILELVKIACSVEDAIVEVKTNGSLKGEKVYKELAKYLNTKKRKVYFSVDAFGKRNAIYRRGTNWEKIVENMNAFSEGGGKGAIKAVFFEQNMDDYRKLERLTRRLGFVSFFVHPNRVQERKERDLIFKIPKDYKLKDYVDMPSDYVQHFKHYKTVKCRHIDEEYYFIGSDSKVYPCCDLWGDMVEEDPRVRRLSQIVTSSKSNEISLKHHSFYDIIQGDRFKKLDNTIKNKPNLLCKKNCGDKSDKMDAIFKVTANT